MDWWKELDAHWDNLLAFVDKYVGLSRRDCEAAGSYLQSLTVAKESKDWRTLQRIFQQAWWLAPDTLMVHANASWQTLCGLLSEIENAIPLEEKC